MQVTLNGEARDVEAGTTVGALVDVITSDRSRVAVERNKKIVPRAAYDESRVEDGAVIELVTMVGGG